MIIKRTRYFSSKDDKKKKRSALVAAGAGLTAGTALAIGLAIRNKNKKAAKKAAEEVIKKSEAERQRIKKEAEEYVKSREAQTKKDVDRLNELREDLQKVYKGEKPIEAVAEKAKEWGKVSKTASELAKSDPDFAKQMEDILG